EHQIEADGKQPEELSRTLSLWYSTFNLQAWFSLAGIAEQKGVDLWNYQTADNRSLRKAFDYLLPYALNEKPWPHQQISEYKTS
ncbi:alginate lyase family protein, partial [Acinetobacter baumannii]